MPEFFCEWRKTVAFDCPSEKKEMFSARISIGVGARLRGKKLAQDRFQRSCKSHILRLGALRGTFWVFAGAEHFFVLPSAFH